MEDVISEFVYSSIDDAIKTNSFFYNLFGNGINDSIVNDLRKKLSSFVDEKGYIHLSDITKLIVCSNG